jgi:hypothetical protein
MSEPHESTAPPLPEESMALLADWWRRARESQYVHYECSSHFSRRHLWLGIPTGALSTVAGLAAFASLATRVGGVIGTMVVGLFSISAALLAGLQTFLGLSKRADEHRALAAKYAAVRRKLEQLKTFPPGAHELEVAIDEVRREMDWLAETAPEMPAFLKIKARVDTRLKEKGDEGIFRLAPESPKTP